MKEVRCVECGQPYPFIPPGQGPYKGRCVRCRIRIGGQRVARRLTGWADSCDAPQFMEGTFFKQPGEVFDVELDMTKFVPEADPPPAVNQVSVTAVLRIKDPVTGEESDGADSTSAIISSAPEPPAVLPGTARVIWWLKGGVAGERHKITVKITFASGQTREADVGLEVRAV